MKKGVYRTVCQFCHTGCGVRVYRGTSGIEKVEGDPEHPVNRGYLCVKGAAIREFIGSKDRIKYPLRKMPKGFKRISWDEALDFAAQRLGEIRERFGSGSLVRNAGAPVSYEARDGFLQFMGAVGSQNLTGTGNLCMLPRMTAFHAMMGARPESDFDRANLIIFWGANPLASNRFGRYCAYDGFHKIIPRMKQRGARIIAIDPIRSETVPHADEWVRINPGTDVALGLAMIHQIIAEELYDKEFVSQWTSGFDDLSMHVEACSPKRAEAITGISEDAIINLARLYAVTKPAAICDGNGTDMYMNSVDAARTIATLVALTGNVDVPGGNAFVPFAIQSVLPTKNVPVQTRLWHERFPLYTELPFPAVKESILRHEQNRPRAMIVHHSNPVLVQANESRTRQALEDLDFLMVNDIFMTSTAELADLVLPSTSSFERHGYKAYSSFEGGFFGLYPPSGRPAG